MNLRVYFGELIEFVIRRVGRRLVIGDENALSRRLREIPFESDEVDFGRLFAEVGREMERDAVYVGEFDDFGGIFYAAV